MPVLGGQESDPASPNSGYAVAGKGKRRQGDRRSQRRRNTPVSLTNFDKNFKKPPKIDKK
jgi:hypothetical protein